MDALWPVLETNLREYLTRANIFKPEAIEDILRRVRQDFTHVNDLRCFGAIEEGRVLSTDEKKRLGLNVRTKFTEEFIALVDLSKIEGESPIVSYCNAYMDAVLRTGRQFELERMRRIGTLTVEILDPYSSMGGCGAKRKQSYDIDVLPSLPLKGCEQDYCKCIYVAKI